MGRPSIATKLAYVRSSWHSFLRLMRQAMAHRGGLVAGFGLLAGGDGARDDARPRHLLVHPLVRRLQVLQAGHFDHSDGRGAVDGLDDCKTSTTEGSGRDRHSIASRSSAPSRFHQCELLAMGMHRQAVDFCLEESIPTCSCQDTTCADSVLSPGPVMNSFDGGRMQ